VPLTDALSFTSAFSGEQFLPLRELLASFVATPLNETLFVGLFAIRSVGKGAGRVVRSDLR